MCNPSLKQQSLPSAARQLQHCYNKVPSQLFTCNTRPDGLFPYIAQNSHRLSSKHPKGPPTFTRSAALRRMLRSFLRGCESTSSASMIPLSIASFALPSVSFTTASGLTAPWTTPRTESRVGPSAKRRVTCVTSSHNHITSHNVERHHDHQRTGRAAREGGGHARGVNRTNAACLSQPTVGTTAHAYMLPKQQFNRWMYPASIVSET